MNEMNTGERIATAPMGPRNDMTRVRTPEAVGAEIRNLTSAARYLNVYYAVEIGRRLTEAKELVAHGEWLNWLKTETEFSQPTASRFMRVYAEYGADQGNLFGAETKYSSLNNLSVSNALRLLEVPEEEREGFALEVDAEHLSTRELEEAIRERDEARKALQEAREGEEKRRAEVVAPYEARITELERAVDDAQNAAADVDLYKSRAQLAEDEVKDLEKRVKELETRPIDVAVQEPDPDAVERMAAELANKAIAAESEKAEQQIRQLQADKAAAEAQVKAAEEKAKAERDKLKEKLKAAEEKLAGAGAEDKAAAEAAQAEVASLKKQLAMSGEAMVQFKFLFTEWQTVFSRLQRAIDELEGEQREKAHAAVRAQAERWGTA